MTSKNITESQRALQFGFNIEYKPDTHPLQEGTLIKNVIKDTNIACEGYFVSPDHFGSLVSENDRVNLVLRTENQFNLILCQIQREIIIKNALISLLYDSLSLTKQGETINEATIYMADYSEKGTYQLERILSNGKYKDRKTVSEFIDKSKSEAEPIRNTFNNSYIKKITDSTPTLNEYFKRFLKNPKSKESHKLPLVDGLFWKKIIDNYTLINKLEKLEKQNSYNNTDTIYNIVFSTYEDIIKRYNNSNNIESKLDYLLLIYQYENIMHPILQSNIYKVKTLLKDKYQLNASFLDDAFYRISSSHIVFGLDTLMLYPIKLIGNTFATHKGAPGYTNQKIYAVNHQQAARLWLNNYCDYLYELTYVTFPVYRTALEVFLYNECKLLLSAKKVEPSKGEIYQKMHDLLKLFITDHLNDIYIDYSKQKLDYKTINLECYNFSQNRMTSYFNSLEEAYKNFDPFTLKNSDNYKLPYSQYNFQHILSKKEPFLKEMAENIYSLDNMTHPFFEPIAGEYFDWRNNAQLDYFRQQQIKLNKELLIAKEQIFHS